MENHRFTEEQNRTIRFSHQFIILKNRRKSNQTSREIRARARVGERAREIITFISFILTLTLSLLLSPSWFTEHLLKIKPNWPEPNQVGSIQESKPMNRFSTILLHWEPCTPLYVMMLSILNVEKFSWINYIMVYDAYIVRIMFILFKYWDKCMV